VTPADIVLVLLAAGRGTRFGGGKLSAPLDGKPLARHAADRFRTLPFAAHLAVVAPDTPPLPGYTAVPLDPPGAPQSRSLALGIAAALPFAPRAVLIALADMPLVPIAHIERMITIFDGDRLASRGPNSVLPPALFAIHHAPALMALTGDRGAGSLLRDASTLALPDGTALDIDRPEDLALAARLLAQ
jgi:molybdenum cofactor cytidylyltransferase